MTTGFAEDGGWNDENAGDKGANPEFGQPVNPVEPGTVNDTGGIGDAGTDYLDGDNGEPASSLTADDYSSGESTPDLSALDVNALDTPYDETETDRVFTESDGSDSLSGDTLGSADDYDSTGSDGGTDSMEGLSEPTGSTAGYGNNDSLGDVGASDSGDYATAGDVGVADTYEPVGDPNFESGTEDQPQTFDEGSETAQESTNNNDGGFMDKAKEKLNDLMGGSNGGHKT